MLFESLGGQSVKILRVDRRPGSGKTSFTSNHFFCFDVRIGGRLHDRHNVKIVGLGKIKVSRIVRGNGHDGSRTVTGQHVVGDPDRDRIAVNRINCMAAGKDSCLTGPIILAIPLAFQSRILAVLFDSRPLVGGRQLVDQRMLGRNHHVRRSKQGIRPGRINPQYIVSRRFGKSAGFAILLPLRKFCLGTDEKVNLGTLAATDPIALQFFDPGWPIDLIEILFQTIAVSRDSQHPLSQRHPLNRMATDFGKPIDNFFVGQHSTQGWAPVHRRVGFVSQTIAVLILTDFFFTSLANTVGDGKFVDRTSTLQFVIKPGVKQDQENPLSPFDVIHVGRGNHAIPVIAETEVFQLANKRLDVFFCEFAGGCIVLDRVFFRWQTEGIEPHRVQDGHPLHA